MNLGDSIKKLVPCEVRGKTDLVIRDICYHSKRVAAGSLFVAIPGQNADGRDYVAQAVADGAVAVVFEGKFFDNLRSTQIRVSGARLALARLSAEHFVHPTKSLYLAGVTGTNGKTTFTYLMEALWQETGESVGVVGTVNARYGKTEVHLGQTTPESRDLQELFFGMVKEGITKACVEVSSHALVCERVAECHFDAAVFTNLSQDHLDFHQTMEEYAKAKELFFTRYLPASEKKNKLAIICMEEEAGERMAREASAKGLRVVRYGFGEQNDVFPETFQLNPDGLTATIRWGLEKFLICSPLMGRFNLLNIMAAVVAGRHSGLSREQIEQGILKCRLVPGRLERILDPKGRLVFVDYAHTPDALNKVLQTVRELTRGNLITVFGCGGDRDPQKRPLMGWEAARHSDFCVVTSDNPRTEDPLKIIDQILPGVEQGGMTREGKQKGYWVEPDRKRAIAIALEKAKKGDVVVIAGKGHEDYQIIGTKKFPFSDQQVVRGAL